jgi:beta-xylosidase
VPLTGSAAGRPVLLRVTARDLALRFAWSTDGAEWRDIGPAFDETKLSDEFCTTGEFTGAFVGICCQDLARREALAWFDWFEILFQNTARRRCEACGVKNRETDTSSALSAL